MKIVTSNPYSPVAPSEYCVYFNETELLNSAEQKHPLGRTFLKVLSSASSFLKRTAAIIVQVVSSVFNKTTSFFIGKRAPSEAITVLEENHPSQSDEPVMDIPWRQQALTLSQSLKRMWRNSEKAIKEHIGNAIDSAYAPLEYALAPQSYFETPIHKKPLNFSCSHSKSQGRRPTMEDVCFNKEVAQGLLTGLFDGHGGKEAAKYAKKAFIGRFEHVLESKKGNVHQTFESLFYQIQKKIEENKELNYQGTTAVVCFIDRNTHAVYTATLGDSEANVYRKIDKHIQSIPLSAVRNWSSKRDAQRAAIILEDQEVAESWARESNPKNLRIAGLNVSRALGDAYINEIARGIAVIPKPKITINTVFSGYKIVLACDGIKDYVSEKEIIQLIEDQSEESENNLAKTLVDFAIDSKKSRDNATAIVIDIT